MARPTPHQIAAAAVVVVALLVAASPLLTGGGSYPLPRDEPRVATPAAAVLPSTAATRPLVAGFDHAPESSPFSLRATSAIVGLPKIGLPPPPPLAPPGLPVLPIPEGR